MKPISSNQADQAPVPGAGMSIAEVERETGLGKDSLRVWERRYGFPQPLRDLNGDRIYPPDQVQRLRLVKRLLDDAHRPSQVVALDLAALNQLLTQDTVRPKGKRVIPLEQPARYGVEASQWIEWLARDEHELLKQQLQQLIWREGLARVVDDAIGPLCVSVGEAWLRGQVSVYQEHLFTQTLQSVLREAIAGVDSNTQNQLRSPRILLTTTPGEQHALGLLMAECHFALEACQRWVLGISTPKVDIVQAVDRLNIDVLALSFSAYATRRDIQDNLQWLRQQLTPSVEIWVGGSAAQTHQKFLPSQVTLFKRAADAAEQVRLWRQMRSVISTSGESK